MSAYQVAVVADETSQTAGTAVIRIDGLKTWPENATLRILPIDEAAVPPQSEGWPWGDITPLRVIETEAGVDVVLGPDVVGSARLVPGTPITIKVPGAKLEVDARWPSVTPTVRRRASAVAMSGTQLLAAKAEREQKEKETTVRRQEMADFAARSAREAAADAQKSKPVIAPLSVAPDRAAETGQLARLLPMRRPEIPNAKPAEPAPGQLKKLDMAPPSNIVPVKVAPAAPEDPPAPKRRWATAGMRGFAAGLATMAVVALGLFKLVPPSWLPPGLGAGPIAAIAGDQIGMVDLRDMFKDLRDAGPRSPRNKPAGSVDAATALSLADHSLRGERTAEETEEAQFWLKRALAANFAGADVGWALTQLGTIYATPGTPDHNYVKAHTLWEMAAAQGDPVAHCFLGALYEHGLGVQKSRATALGHYKTADTLGACRSAKDAVARLSE